MQNFIFRVGIFWWKLCLPIFALCVGVLIIAICCDCLTVSLQYGFWVAFWDKNTLYECLVLTGTLVSFLWEDHIIANDSKCW